MCIHRIESVPQTWDDQRDTAFFRIASFVFSTEFVYGAGVLLAGNDTDDADIAPCRCEQSPVAVSVESAELVPVRVRRGDRA